MQSRTTITGILMACDRFVYDLMAFNTVHDEITVEYTEADAKATVEAMMRLMGDDPG